MSANRIHAEFAPIEIDGLPSQRIIPLDRYRSILSHLDSAGAFALDEAWLCFAAQEAVLCPDDTADIAHKILEVAALLQQESRWSRDFASSMRYIIAGLIVRQNISFADFIAHHVQTISVLRDAGLRSGGVYETIAILIIHMSARSRPFGQADAKRIKTIYDDMKSCHWWLTGANDLPDCAALSECPQSAEFVISRAEAAYQSLRAAGMPSGCQLQTAANILPLWDDPMGDIVKRWLALHKEWGHQGPVDPSLFGALSVLSSLDHDPDWIIRKVTAVSDELDLLQPESAGCVNANIAAHLTVLDLMRFDATREPLRGASAIDAMLKRLHLYHIASAVVISQVKNDINPEVVGYGALRLF